MITFIGTDTDDYGTVYMFHGPGMWLDFRLVNGTLILTDYGLCSDWSTYE